MKALRNDRKMLDPEAIEILTQLEYVETILDLYFKIRSHGTGPEEGSANHFLIFDKVIEEFRRYHLGQLIMSLDQHVTCHKEDFMDPTMEPPKT